MQRIMATEIVSKAFLNAYDTAVIISGDSDYIPASKILNEEGEFGDDSAKEDEI